MSEAAQRRMSLEEFLRWDDGTDTRYELIDGVPVAMAPPAEAHRILAMRSGSRIDAALERRRPCNAQIEAGIVRPDRTDSYYIPDIAVTLSPGTERSDRRIKLPVYRTIDSVREILLIDADAHYAELHRREGDRWIIELLRGPAAVLSLGSVELQIPLGALYEGIAVIAAAEG